VCVCVYGCLQARVSVCLCERGGGCVSERVFVYVCVCACVKRWYLCVNESNALICVLVRERVCVCVCVKEKEGLYMCVCVCV